MEEETKKTEEESTVTQETTPTPPPTNVVVKSSTVLEEKLAEKVLKEEKKNTTTTTNTTTAPPQNVPPQQSAPKAPPQNIPKQWSSAEHSLLLGLHNTYGDNWDQISKFMPGRTPDEIASRHREVMTQAQRSSREMLSKMMINPQQPLFAALASLAGGIRPSGIPSPAVIPAMSAALKTNGQSRAMNLYELLYQKRAPGAMGGIPPNFIPPPIPPPNMNPLSQQQMMMMLQAQQQQQQQFPPNLNLMAAFRNNPPLPYPLPPPGLLPMFPPMMNPSLMRAQQNPLLRQPTTPVTQKPKLKRKSSKKKQEAPKTKKEEWVQCDRCKKWRKLPQRVSAKKLPDIWYCEMTTWGRRKVTCDTPVQSDKKKSSNVENNAKKNKEEEEKKIAKVEWVQCETCLTWRKLPLTIKASSLPDKWYCRMNHWDKSRASCSAPQEIVETVRVRLRVGFTTYITRKKNPTPTLEHRYEEPRA